MSSVSILFIMDKSGSMTNMGVEPVEGLNNFFEEQKTVASYTATLVLFNEKPEFVFTNKASSEIEKLSHDQYAPNGMTALYDAICSAIEKQKETQIDNVICVILTDGLENSSKEYDSKTTKNLITQMEKDHNWKFMYLGANQDSFSVGGGLGINKTHDYEYSPIGCNHIMRTISSEVSRCISQTVEPVKESDIGQPTLRRS